MDMINSSWQPTASLPAPWCWCCKVPIKKLARHSLETHLPASVEKMSRCKSLASSDKPEINLQTPPVKLRSCSRARSNTESCRLPRSAQSYSARGSSLASREGRVPGISVAESGLGMTLGEGKLRRCSVEDRSVGGRRDGSSGNSIELHMREVCLMYAYGERERERGVLRRCE